MIKSVCDSRIFQKLIYIVSKKERRAGLNLDETIEYFGIKYSLCSGTPATPSMPAPSTPGLQPPTPDVKPPIPETPKEDIKPLPFPFEKEPETKVNLKHA